MKKIILHITLIAILAFAYGCSKKDDSSVTVAQPQGTFAGIFTRYHYNVSTQTVDSAKASLQLLLSSSNYKITGDTSSLQAGSYGTFQYDNSYLSFTDKTLPATGTYTAAQLAKIHLNSTYQYVYDGSTLQLQARNDTLIYFYNFKKQ